MIPDQRESLERKTPVDTGVLALCQSMFMRVKLYCFVSIFIVENQSVDHLWITYSTVTDFARLRG